MNKAEMKKNVLYMAQLYLINMDVKDMLGGHRYTDAAIERFNVVRNELIDEFERRIYRGYKK